MSLRGISVSITPDVLTWAIRESGFPVSEVRAGDVVV